MPPQWALLAYPNELVSYEPHKLIWRNGQRTTEFLCMTTEKKIYEIISDLHRHTQALEFTETSCTTENFIDILCGTNTHVANIKNIYIHMQFFCCLLLYSLYIGECFALFHNRLLNCTLIDCVVLCAAVYAWSVYVCACIVDMGMCVCVIARTTNGFSITIQLNFSPLKWWSIKWPKWNYTLLFYQLPLSLQNKYKNQSDEAAFAVDAD